jgi:hypothetical protein
VNENSGPIFIRCCAAQAMAKTLENPAIRYGALQN